MSTYYESSGRRVHREHVYIHRDVHIGRLSLYEHEPRQRCKVRIPAAIAKAQSAKQSTFMPTMATASLIVAILNLHNKNNKK